MDNNRGNIPSPANKNKHLPAARCCGAVNETGGGIVRTLAAELRRQGVDWIGLVGAPGTEKFYRDLGLTAPAGYTFYQID